MQEMRIRRERAGDEEALHRLTLAAFAPMSFSDGTEADALATLRRNGDLTLSLVAVEGERIVGHVAFSPVTIGAVREGWFGLGPISVTPDRQRAGIGSALIGTGMDILTEGGAAGCVLVGDPAYYGRFDFVNDGAVTYLDTATRYVQWRSFTGDRPGGEIRFREGLQE